MQSVIPRLPTLLARSLLILLLLGLSACSSTMLTTRWHDPDYQGAPFKRVLVIAMLQDEVKRRALEQALVQRLGDSGVVGIASYKLIDDPRQVDEKSELVAAVKQAQADSVLISRLLGVDKESRYVPPRVDWIPSAGYGGFGYYDYYYRNHQAVYQPGYHTIDTIVRLEIKAFSAESEALVWAGNTESFNPQSADKVINELAKLIVDDIKSSGLIR